MRKELIKNQKVSLKSGKYIIEKICSYCKSKRTLSIVATATLLLASTVLMQTYGRGVTTNNFLTDNLSEDSNNMETGECNEHILDPSGIINGHGYVDLGLSVKWATCNVGARSLSDGGDLYAWGGTSHADTFDDDCETIDKNIGDIGGNPKYDVARAKWGDSWRLPTKGELEELVNNCILQYGTFNDRNGLVLTSKVNGKAIFIPASGRCNESILIIGDNTCGAIWSSTPNSDTYRAFMFGFVFDELYCLDYAPRQWGFSVRPVLK